MTVICDASPLILLAKIERLALLPVLYERVVVPEAVVREVEAKAGHDTQRLRRWWRQSDVCCKEVSHAHLDAVDVELGSGERAVLALAVRTEAPLALFDDIAARRAARRLGLPVTGTLGVLVEARARKEVSSLRAEMDRLVSAGMWLGEALYSRLLREFDEE